MEEFSVGSPEDAISLLRDAEAQINIVERNCQGGIKTSYLCVDCFTHCKTCTGDGHAILHA
jgi:hypothetical protein